MRTPIPCGMDGAAMSAEPLHPLPGRGPGAAPVGSSSGRVGRRGPCSPALAPAGLSWLHPDRDGEWPQRVADPAATPWSRMPYATSQVRRRAEPSPLGPFLRRPTAPGWPSKTMAQQPGRSPGRSGRADGHHRKTLRRRFFSLAGRLTRSARPVEALPSGSLALRLRSSAAPWPGATPPAPLAVFGTVGDRPTHRRNRRSPQTEVPARWPRRVPCCVLARHPAASQLPQTAIGAPVRREDRPPTSLPQMEPRLFPL